MSQGFKTSSSPPAGLYVHIPFCVRKCRYCDFCSITDASLQEPYVKALLREMALYSPHAATFDTLYLGGGTPSILDSTAIARIIATARDLFTLQPASEMTIEINPGTIDPSKLAAYRRAGINRINIGVQSFDPVNLRFLGRIHTAQESTAGLEAARRAGFDNVGIDLIYGLPGQTEANWQADLVRALALQPEHLACYALTYEPGTPLEQARSQGRIVPLDGDRVGDLMALMQHFLAANGYAQYEISNFARIDHGDPAANRSRHNRKYWNGASYLGLGPSAHSYDRPRRWWNMAPVSSYIAALDKDRRPLEGQERLTREQQMIEALYLGLRQTAGIETAAFAARFAVDFQANFGQSLADLAQDGILTLGDGRCALTRKGMRLLDSVVARLI